MDECCLKPIHILLEGLLGTLDYLGVTISSLMILDPKSIGFCERSRQIYKRCDATRQQLLEPRNHFLIQASRKNVAYDDIIPS